MNPNIVGYHTNTEKRVRSFLEKNELVLSDDTHYLGLGMYFWDNLSNAKYWANKKKEESGSKTVYICKANIFIQEPILDLTDKETVKVVRDLWYSFCDKTDEKERYQPIGVILNTLFKVFPDKIGKFEISKAHGDYSTRYKMKFLQRLGNYSYIDDRPKTIYAVRAISRIKNQSQHITV